MPTTEEQLLSILLNSKIVPQLPLVESFDDTDWDTIYDTSTGKFSKILPSLKSGLNSFDVSFLGAVTTISGATDGTNTDAQIESFINLQGFTIPSGKIKVIQANVFVENIVYKKSYFYKPNIVGEYGTTAANPIVFSNLLEFNSQRVTINNTIIDLGDIGSDTVFNYINTTNSIDYALELNNTYVFKCIIDAVQKYYLYVGTQPLLLGLGNNMVDADDFVDITPTAEVSGSQLRTVKVSVLASEVLDIYDNPITLIPATGANTYINVVDAYVKVNFNSVAYNFASSRGLYLTYTSPSSVSTYRLGHTILNAAADSIGKGAIAGDIEIQINSPIYLTVLSAAFLPTLGDSPIDVYVTYTVVDVTTGNIITQ